MFDGGVHTCPQVAVGDSDASSVKKLSRILFVTLTLAASACSAAAPLPPAQNLPAEQSTPFFVLENSGNVIGDLDERTAQLERNELPD